jgi:hypothetical protein
MKFVLTIIMCTSVYNMCLEPFPMPTKYSTHYECMIAGYEESIKKAKEIGPEEINKYGTIIKFFCMQEKDFPKKGQAT